MTDLLAAEARRQRRQRPVMRESLEQQSFIELCIAHRNHPQYGIIHRVVFAIPNGADVAPHHRDRLVREGLAPGYPDIGIDLARGGYHGLRIEMKRPKEGGNPAGRIRPEQRERHDLLRHCGYRVDVCYTADGAWQLCCAYVDGRLLKNGNDERLAGRAP